MMMAPIKRSSIGGILVGQIGICSSGRKKKARPTTRLNNPARNASARSDGLNVRYEFFMASPFQSHLFRLYYTSRARNIVFWLRLLAKDWDDMKEQCDPLRSHCSFMSSQSF